MTRDTLLTMTHKATPAARSPSTPKRKRRSAAEMRRIRDAIYAFCFKQKPVGVRQTAYNISTLGLIAKTEQEFKQIGRLMGEMREDGSLPFDWVTDNSRWMRKPRTYSGLAELMQNTAALYRRDLWRSMDAYCEIWCEKHGMMGVLYPVTSEFDVPLMLTGGFASKSFLHSAAKTIEAQGKPSYIYLLGDHDPSGVAISKKIAETLQRYAPDAEMYFERVAVTEEQIERLSLPSRPTKKTDTRSKNFIGDSVELDAMSTADLQAIIRHCIERHIDPAQLATIKVAEASEREYLDGLAAQFNGAA